VYQHVYTLIICKESRDVLRKIFQHNVCNDNDFTVQIVKRVFKVYAILIHDTLQTTFPLFSVVISEAPWQCAPPLHDRLL